MTLALLLAAFLSIVLAFGALVAVHDALEAAWRRAATRRSVARASGAAGPRSRPEAALARRSRQRGGRGRTAGAPAWAATAPARTWRHLH